MEEQQQQPVAGAPTMTKETLNEGVLPTQQQQQQQHHSTGTSLTRFLICMAPVMVPLPGSNESSIEQPAILQVLSPLNAPEENDKLAKTTQQVPIDEPLVNSDKLSQDIAQHHNENVDDDDKIDDIVDKEDDVDVDNSHSLKNLVSRIVLDNLLTDPNSNQIQKSTTKDCKNEIDSLAFPENVEEKEKEDKLPHSPTHSDSKNNILDIESHLIETLNEIAPSKESVGINELPPAGLELLVGCSKIETKDNVRTVIEVEPAEVVTKKPVEQIIATDDPLRAAQIEVPTDYLNGDCHLNQEEIEEVAKRLVHDIEEEVIKALETNTLKVNDILRSEEKTEEAAPEVTTDSRDQTDCAPEKRASELSQVVDQQLSEVTCILESQNLKATEKLQVPQPNLKVVTVPSPQTASEEAERKLFIDSLPALHSNEHAAGAEQLALDCKKEYYQSLKKYLLQSDTENKPPRPLQTYRWEDLRRAKERGGYPWTHLYKRPLGPDEQPEIVLMLRKSQEIRFLSESPKSNKKVRIDDQVLIQETHPYLQELSEEEEEEEGHHSEHHLPTQDHENHSLHSESFSCVSDSVLATAKSKAANRFNKVRRLFRRRRYGARTNDDAQSLPDSFTNNSLKQSLDKVPQTPSPQPPVHPIYEHPKSPRCFPIMKKLKSMADRQKKRLSIKRIHLVKDDKVTPVPDEEPRIIRLKDSPKSQRSDIPHFVEKQDSDDVLEIVELDESPSRKRLGHTDSNADDAGPSSSIVKPEEIIEIGEVKVTTGTTELPAEQENGSLETPPKKAPRLRREHVYEEIDHPDDVTAAAAEELKFILDATSVDALKQSLASQDTSAVDEVAATKHTIPLDRMGSSEEEAITTTERATPERKSNSLLAPISSIDSASSDEDRSKMQLQPVTEEEEETADETTAALSKHLEVVNDTNKQPLKKEASPAPSDKKVVTFSHVEDEADPHREDIELPAEQMEAAKEANKWKTSTNDHEYEPIGTPSAEERSSVIKDQPPSESHTTTTTPTITTDADQMRAAFKPAATAGTVAPTPQTEIVVDAIDDIDEPAYDGEAPPKSGMKSFMASAQDRTRKMQMGLKTQAGKLKTKLKPTAKKPPSGSPKAKDRKMFKAPEFSKIKMPQLKKPDMSKLRDFKRPEFTKFSKPDLSKFKMPEMSAMKLGRSKSFKETDTHMDEDVSAENAEVTKKATEATSPQKKLFDFNFGTYPRALRKKKKPVEPESSFGTATEATSVIPSTETQPSMESSGSPQGDRGPGPVRSRWADKFSDVSYNDSEGSRYRRYGSELESFDRESSLERRMREDLEDTVSEEPTMGILGAVTDNRQFAEFDEENRAIHEISNLRSGEFKRRPMVHQDSDVRSEDSKDAVGWTEREIQKNTLLRKAEIEAEASYLKYQPEEIARQDTQSTASSGKKVVLEEIGEDEFFLRKRGISQDNIEINQYIRNAFHDEYDKPINSLQHVGQTSDYGDYDVPPPKPRRLHKQYQPDNVSQEFESYGDDFSMSHNGSDYMGAPRRPMRKNRSRSKFSMDSQEVRYMDEEYLRDPSRESGMWNDLNVSSSGKENIPVRHEHSLHDEDEDVMRPQPPRRQKRRRDNSMDKDSYINGFGGRSVSNSFLQPTEDVIVYRTEHEYHHVPLATPDKYSDSLSTRKSTSHYDMDDRISRGAISLEQNDAAHHDEADRYVIDMMENDGYAIVRKEQVPKPTPPSRRKRFTHAPTSDRFATMPNMRTKRATPPPERPPPPRGYTPVSDIVMPTVRKSALSLEARPTYEDDYEEPGRPESPRNNLQSGEVINKMKYRPLPPPPRPPREKRNRSMSKGSEALQLGADEVDVVDGLDDANIHFEEVEASTQTDPLPDDFVCEEFEITEDMKIIEPRIRAQTVEDMLKEELEKELANVNHQVIDGDELAKGLQRFREANQRSLSERSRASSLRSADRSKSQSRPQTPSAIIVERHSATPVQKENESMVEASLIVRPIDDLELEEEELRREGLLTDSSQLSLAEADIKDEDYIPVPVSEHSYAPSSAELDEALGNLASDQETQHTDEEVERTLQRYRDELDEIGRQLMETQTTSQEVSPSVSHEEIRISDREEPATAKQRPRRSKRSLPSPPPEPKDSDSEELTEISDREEPVEISREDLREPWQLSDIEEMRSDLEEPVSERESTAPSTATPRNETEEEVTTAAPEEYHVEIPTEDKPLPPPRRKSTTAMDQPISPLETEEHATVTSRELTPLHTIAKTEAAGASQLPARVADLEVERLRVHALQAGQIMVSQLHGQQISSDELECKSGNLVVQNIELPPGLIENIVERVRQSERSQHLTVETQTSLQNSSESSPTREVIPPPKPPRLREVEASAAAARRHVEPLTLVQNTDEQTQTEADETKTTTSAVTTQPPQVPVMPAIFPTPEYLQSLAPLAFYNLHRAQAELAGEVRAPHRQRQRRSASPDGDHSKEGESSDPEPPRRRRTRSTRSSPPEEPESVTKAGSNFITACSLSLARIINQITDYIRGKEPKEGLEDSTDVRSRQVPALVVLFIVITFVVLIFLMTGQNVHTHHWDYFNPPGHEGRPS